MNTIADLRVLAQAAYEAHELPSGILIDDQEGFEIHDGGAEFELSRKVYFYSEHDDEESNSLIGYFNMRISADNLDITSAYLIAIRGGVLVGEFTDESRRTAYAAADLADPRDVPALAAC